MKNFIKCFIVLVLFSIIPIKSQNSYLDWFLQAGSRSNDIARDVYVDNFGFIYFIAQVSDTTTFPDTTIVTNFSDICLTKMNPLGEVLWIKIIGGNLLDKGLDIKTDINDDIIITGAFSGTVQFGNTTLVSSGFTDVFIAKYNPNGVFQWVIHGAGPDHDEGLCIAIDNLNDIYVGGFFENSLQIGTYNLVSSGTYETLFYTKISSSGNVLWAEQAYTTDYSESSVESICFDGNDIVLTGIFDDTMVFQGDTLFSMDGSEDVFVAKVDITGNKIWLKQAGGDYDDGGRAIISDGTGNLFLAGYFSQTANFGTFQFTSTDSNDDVFISGLDVNGSFTWVKHGSGPGYDYPTSISYNQVNGISVCGITTGGFNIGNLSFSGDATDDIFVTNFSTSGSIAGVLYAGSLGEERVYDIYLDDSNSAFIVGGFIDSIGFGDTLIASQNILDELFIAKINMNNISDVKEIKNDFLPDEFSLSQNYPNPFNPTTKIKYQIPEPSLVILKVYDVLGNELATLVDEYKPIGEHEVEFNASSINHHPPSGIYFYQLKAGSFIKTKKMVLLK